MDSYINMCTHVHVHTCPILLLYIFYFTWVIPGYIKNFIQCKRSIGRVSVLVTDFWNGGGRNSKNLLLHNSNENSGKTLKYTFLEGWKLIKDNNLRCIYLRKMAESL